MVVSGVCQETVDEELKDATDNEDDEGQEEKEEEPAEEEVDEFTGTIEEGGITYDLRLGRRTGECISVVWCKARGQKKRPSSQAGQTRSSGSAEHCISL